MSSTPWWEILITAFFAALAGASIGGWITFRERLRTVRATLFGGYVVPFHDDVASRRKRVADGKEPIGTGFTRGRVDPGGRFQLLDHQAATASRFDRVAVRAMWTYLQAIDEAGKPYNERRADDPNPTAIARSCAQAELEQWNALDAYLWRYRAWLEWKLTKRLWSLRMPKDFEQTVRQPPMPPKRLRV